MENQKKYSIKSILIGYGSRELAFTVNTFLSKYLIFNCIAIRRFTLTIFILISISRVGVSLVILLPAFIPCYMLNLINDITPLNLFIIIKMKYDKIEMIYFILNALLLFR